MTEDEAKTKWCCGPKIIADQRHASELLKLKPPQPAGVMANGLCIGSACMAWRVDDMGSPAEAPDPDSPNLIIRIGTAERPPSGHCGLAGKP